MQSERAGECHPLTTAGSIAFEAVADEVFVVLPEALETAHARRQPELLRRTISCHGSRGTRSPTLRGGTGAGMVRGIAFTRSQPRLTASLPVLSVILRQAEVYGYRGTGGQ